MVTTRSRPNRRHQATPRIADGHRARLRGGTHTLRAKTQRQLATLTLEDKHLKQIDSWYFNYLRRVVGIKASYYSRIPNKAVWIKANKPATPSQTLMSAQFKLLTESILTPTDDPFHHSMFSPGYTDRVGIQRNSKRGPRPPHWLGLTSQRALTYFAQDAPTQPGYSSQTRLDLLGLKQYITKHPEYPARLAAAPTRSAETFNYFRSPE